MPLCTAEECRSKLADFDVRRGQPHRRQLMGKRLKQVVPDNVTRSGDCGVSPIQVEGPRRLGGGATTLVLMISILASLREQAAPDHTCLRVFDLLVVNVNYSGTETSPGLVPRIRDEAGAQSASSAQYERHSHSMVAGGLDVTSKTTRLTSATEFVIRVEIRASTS